MAASWKNPFLFWRKKNQKKIRQTDWDRDREKPTEMAAKKEIGDAQSVRYCERTTLPSFWKGVIHWFFSPFLKTPGGWFSSSIKTSTTKPAQWKRKKKNGALWGLFQNYNAHTQGPSHFRSNGYCCCGFTSAFPDVRVRLSTAPRLNLPVQFAEIQRVDWIFTPI